MKGFFNTAPVFIDSGVYLEKNGDKLTLVEDETYKYLMFSDISSTAGVFPWMSKDGKEWRICFGAYKDDELIDLQSIISNLNAEIGWVEKK